MPRLGTQFTHLLVMTGAALLAALLLFGAGATTAQALPSIRDIPVTDDGFGDPLPPRILPPLDPDVRAADDDELVNVPDPILAEVLREKIGQEELTRGKLRRISSLILNDYAITDLTGLEYATQLSDLEMKRTLVTSLEPLRNLERLAYFFAAGSPISTIEPFTGSPRLNYVSLNSTQITDISALRGSTTLVRLEIASTQISDLSALQDSPNFREIYAQDTLVSDLSPLGGLRELRTVSVPNAQVSDIMTIAGLPELTILNVNGNHVTNISMLDSWPKLQQVGFSGQTVTLATVYPSATETSFQKADTARDFLMPDGAPVEVASGATARPGGGAVWQGLSAATAEISASYSHQVRGSAPRYQVTASYPVVRADFDVAPAEGAIVTSELGSTVSLDFSTRPEFTGGSYRLLSDPVPGLALDARGVLAGTPQSTGSFEVRVSLDDSHGNIITRAFTLRVTPQAVPTGGKDNAPALAVTGASAPTPALAFAGILSVLGAAALLRGLRGHRVAQ